MLENRHFSHRLELKNSCTTLRVCLPKEEETFLPFP